MEQEQKGTLFSHAIKWGVILAAVGIVLTVLVYAIDYTIFASFKFLGIVLVLSIAVLVYGGIDYRKSIGGYLSYGQAWQHAFIVFAISGAISVVFNIILYTVIDPELPEKVTEAIVENTREMMENFNTPEDQMETALEKTKVDSADRFTVFGMIKGYGFQIIFYAVFSLLIAIFTKRNPPVDQM